MTAIGIAIATASATALVLRPFATSPMPYTWLLPALSLAIGLAMITGAKRT